MPSIDSKIYGIITLTAVGQDRILSILHALYGYDNPACASVSFSFARPMDAMRR